MARNGKQEREEIRKLKMKASELIKIQDKFEKGKIWAICNDSVKEKRILTIPCPNCGSVKITVSNRIFTCKKCKISYRIDRSLGLIKILKNETEIQ